MHDDDDEDEPVEGFGGLICQYVGSSGRSFDDCVILGRRFIDGIGPDPDESDYWILVNQPAGNDETLTHTRWHYKDFLTGIWRSTSGKVYVADATLRGIRVFEDVMDQSTPPIDYVLPARAVPEGIWGLSDDCVFTWATRMDDQRRRTYMVFRFDGKTWHELPPVRSAISRMHGIAPDLVYAVGWVGLIAKWNGTSWIEFPAPTREILNDVFVETWDEMYAVGAQGMLLEGSASGWGYAGTNPLGPVPFASVAKYKGDLYLGALGAGLLKRRPGTSVIEEFDDEWEAGLMDARENLIITCRTKIVGTSNNTDFSESADNMLYELTGTQGIMRW